MSSMRVCPSGHRWESSPDTHSWCPVCTLVGGDLIPPAPRQATPLPRVPGYEVLDLLGQGGMGVVYRARQQGLQRIVALKFIQGRLDALGPGRELMRKRFLSEGQAIARLSHPNIVAVHEIGEAAATEGQPPVPYLCLEYVGGGNLANRLEQSPLPANAAAALAETLARAVQYVHQHGIAHRDLKPENVLLTQDGVPRIADFGLARLTLPASESQDRPTETGTIQGTPSYMAPEQARPGLAPLGPLADVWALGAILYACLTGRPPFLAASPLDTLYQVLYHEPISPRQLVSSVPMDLETICLKCLQKDPARRYASALALGEDLERFRRGVPVLARPVGRFERVWRWARRNPLLASSLTALGLSILAGLLAVSFFWQAERRQREQAEAALAGTHQVFAGVVARISVDLRSHQDASEAIPREVAMDLLRRLEEYQDLLSRLKDARLTQELAFVEGWRGHLYLVAGRLPEALRTLDAAASRQEGLLEVAPSQESLRTELARTWHALASAQRRSGRPDDAALSARHLVALLKADASAQGDARIVLAAATQELGQDATRRGNLEEALDWFHRAADHWEGVFRSDPSPRWQAARASVEFDLGGVFGQRGDHQEALKHYERARTIQMRLVQEMPGSRRMALALSGTQRAMANVLLRAIPIEANMSTVQTGGAAFLRRLQGYMGKSATLRQARSFLDSAQDTQANLVRQSNEQLSRAWQLTEIDRAVAIARLQLVEGDLKLALTSLELAAPLAEQVARLAPGPEITAERFRIGTYLGLIQRTRGDPKQAMKPLVQAAGWVRDLAAHSDAAELPPRDLGETAYVLAATLRNLGEVALAVPVAEQAAIWQRKALERAPSSRDLRKELSRTLYELAGELRAQRRHEAAARVSRERGRLWPEDAEELHDVACELCMCARVVVYGKAELSDQDRTQRDAYLDEAIRVLQAAVAAGLKGAKRMRQDGDFDPLRGREEFEKLMEEVARRDR